jgi:hypothetical protein
MNLLEASLEALEIFNMGLLVMYYIMQDPKKPNERGLR